MSPPLQIRQVAIDQVPAQFEINFAAAPCNKLKMVFPGFPSVSRFPWVPVDPSGLPWVSPDLGATPRRVLADMV
jgi:hypothetical protein